MTRGKAGYWWYLLPGAVAFTAVVAVPFGTNLYLSLTKWSGIGDPRWIGFDNYTRLLHDDVFWTSFRNTAAMVIAMVVVPTLIGLVLSATLFDVIGRRFGPKTASFLRATFYLPQVLPVVVAGILWGWLLRPDGAVNAVGKAIGLGEHDWLGDPKTALPMVMLVMIWVQIGYPVVIFMAALQRVDPDLYEAAEIDGAGWFRRFQAITLPQIRPETFVITLTCTIAALKVFGPIWALTRGGPNHATTVPSYFAYNAFFNKLQVGYGAAVATALTLVIVAVSIGFLKLQGRTES
ncbi:raffinose/stachyose/melibiose transport system permease protein [Kribbella voronezhensis]|uniref:Raffinose/stachyose/melibiose transport system permease protein n=1 Tax=Kribbella voronezhensis TaxID=2512212 RepID=A0A4R7SXI0_9ACTN|nr:sugar ABC transporter permease [Kribbella voronezhensis]TDU83386.1 raffinose/stachyose/melibiose transport system permease protein [Kribbella voronezhensis]